MLRPQESLAVPLDTHAHLPSPQSQGGWSPFQPYPTLVLLPRQTPPSCVTCGPRQAARLLYAGFSSKSLSSAHLTPPSLLPTPGHRPGAMAILPFSSSRIFPSKPRAGSMPCWKKMTFSFFKPK